MSLTNAKWPKPTGGTTENVVVPLRYRTSASSFTPDYGNLNLGVTSAGPISSLAQAEEFEMAESEYPSREEMNARLEAVRAQNDARFAEVIARLDGLKTEISHLPTVQSMAIGMASAVVATVGLLTAIWAFGGDRFDSGVQLTGMTVERSLEAQRKAEGAEKQAQDANRKLDAVLDILNRRVNTP